MWLLQKDEKRLGYPTHNVAENFFDLLRLYVRPSPTGVDVKFVLWLACLIGSLSTPTWADDALQDAIASPKRTAAFAARDAWRHPYETLKFFGITPDSSVVEISPGGGWYTEILAPYLRGQGQLILAADDPETAKPDEDDDGAGPLPQPAANAITEIHKTTNNIVFFIISSFGYYPVQDMSLL